MSSDIRPEMMSDMQTYAPGLGREPVYIGMGKSEKLTNANEQPTGDLQNKSNDLLSLLTAQGATDLLIQKVGLTAEQAVKVQQLLAESVIKPETSKGTSSAIEELTNKANQTAVESAQLVIDNQQSAIAVVNLEAIPEQKSETARIPSYVSHVTSLSYDALQEADRTVRLTRDASDRNKWNRTREQNVNARSIFELSPQGDDKRNVLLLRIDRNRNSVTLAGAIESQFAKKEQAGRGNAIGFQLAFDDPHEMDLFVAEMEASGTDTLVNTLNQVYRQVDTDNSLPFVHRGVLHKKYLQGTYVFNTEDTPTVIRGPLLIAKLDIQDGTNKRTVNFLKKEQASAQ